MVGLPSGWWEEYPAFSGIAQGVRRQRIVRCRSAPNAQRAIAPDHVARDQSVGGLAWNSRRPALGTSALSRLGAIVDSWN